MERGARIDREIPPSAVVRIPCSDVSDTDRFGAPLRLTYERGRQMSSTKGITVVGLLKDGVERGGGATQVTTATQEVRCELNIASA